MITLTITTIKPTADNMNLVVAYTRSDTGEEANLRLPFLASPDDIEAIMQDRVDQINQLDETIQTVTQTLVGKQFVSTASKGIVATPPDLIGG